MRKRFATRQFMKHNMWKVIVFFGIAQLCELSFSPIQRDRMSLVSPVGDIGSLWLSSLSHMFVETSQVDLSLECVCVV